VPVAAKYDRQLHDPYQRMHNDHKGGEKEWNSLLLEHIASSTPIRICHGEGRTWWMFGGKFYWEDEGYTQDEVKALLYERDRKRERRVQRAIAAEAQARQDSAVESDMVRIWRNVVDQASADGNASAEIWANGHLLSAIADMEQVESQKPSKREPIPDDVKVYVWRRDSGRCVKCGSKENLEYDHIIPLSKGGSNTARNIQLLCETCNRAKGDSLV